MRHTTRIAGLVALILVGCTGPSSGQQETEESYALEDGAFRFCHEPGLDGEELAAWCEIVDDIPEERCPGLRASCEGAEPVSSSGCNDRDPSGSGNGDKGVASEPEKPDEPWSFESWEGPDLAFLGSVGQWLMAILVASGVGVLLYFLWRRFGARGEEQAPLDDVAVELSVVDESELDEALPDVPSAPSRDLLQMARLALAEGRSGEAVVLARGAALRRLGERGSLRLHRSRTDREYVRALHGVELDGDAPEGGSDELRVVVSMAELFRFGHKEPPTNAAADALAAAARLLGGISCILLALMVGMADARAQGTSRYSPRGDAAFGELFRQHGYEVRWRLRGLTDVSDDDTDIIVLDALGLAPTEEEWTSLRNWVGAGHVLVVLGDPSGGFPELGPVGPSEGSLHAAGPVRAAGLEPPILPGGVAAHQLMKGSFAGDDAVPANGLPTAWVEDALGGAAVAVLSVGSGFVVSFADMRFGDNVALAVPANEELLGEVPLLGQAAGWPIATPPRVQLALRATLSSDASEANNPLESLARAELLPFVLQFLLLWAVLSLWRGWPMGPLREDAQRGRIRFADHVEALGERFQRARGSRYALRAYAALWLQRLGPRGLALAATGAGMSKDEAERFVTELEALVEGDSSGRSTAREAAADFERMEVLWTVVEHSKEPSEGSA